MKVILMYNWNLNVGCQVKKKNGDAQTHDLSNIEFLHNFHILFIHMKI